MSISSDNCLLHSETSDTDDPCANMNCGTGGQCLNTDPPSCLCHDGYLGNNCEMGPGECTYMTDDDYDKR